MAWTDAATVNTWIRGVDLALQPTAFNQPIIDAENLLRGRLAIFISAGTLLTWTDATNTPPMVQEWAARIAAAYYDARLNNFQLAGAGGDNPAAALYDEVMAEIQAVQDGKSEILTIAGAVVSRITSIIAPGIVQPESTTGTWPFTSVSDDALE